MNHLLRPGQSAEVAVDDDAVKAVVYKNEKITEQLREQVHFRVYCTRLEETMGRRTIRRGPGSRQVSGKDFHLADEMRYIQRRAAECEARFVTVASLAFFSTETGDAWILDPADHLAARVARDGDPEPLYFEEAETTFAIRWKGSYRIDGNTFVYTDRDTGRMSSIIGYPTRKLAELG